MERATMKSRLTFLFLLRTTGSLNAYDPATVQPATDWQARFLKGPRTLKETNCLNCLRVKRVDLVIEMQWGSLFFFFFPEKRFISKLFLPVDCNCDPFFFLSWVAFGFWNSLNWENLLPSVCFWPLWNMVHILLFFVLFLFSENEPTDHWRSEPHTHDISRLIQWRRC